MQDSVLNYSPRSGLAALPLQSCSAKLSAGFDDAKNASQDSLSLSGAIAADENKFPNDSSKSGVPKSDTAFSNENAFLKYSSLPSGGTEEISCKTYSSKNLDSVLSQETLQKLGHFTGN